MLMFALNLVQFGLRFFYSSADTATSLAPTNTSARTEPPLSQSNPDEEATEVRGAEPTCSKTCLNVKHSRNMCGKED